MTTLRIALAVAFWTCVAATFVPSIVLVGAKQFRAEEIIEQDIEARAELDREFRSSPYAYTLILEEYERGLERGKPPTEAAESARVAVLEQPETRGCCK